MNDTFERIAAALERIADVLEQTSAPGPGVHGHSGARDRCKARVLLLFGERDTWHRRDLTRRLSNQQNSFLDSVLEELSTEGVLAGPQGGEWWLTYRGSQG